LRAATIRQFPETGLINNRRLCRRFGIYRRQLLVKALALLQSIQLFRVFPTCFENIRLLPFQQLTLLTQPTHLTARNPKALLHLRDQLFISILLRLDGLLLLFELFQLTIDFREIRHRNIGRKTLFHAIAITLSTHFRQQRHTTRLLLLHAI
jgi:hypothetical protein